MTRRVVRLAARAKINAFLRVVRRREDGYHEIESLVLPISLSDRVTVRPAETLRVGIHGGEKLTSAVPAGGLNLALVAALALADSCAGAAGADIDIEKRIPVAAGLGGGSADAAAALVALNELWSCGLGPEELAHIGARVGSDVPALLAGGPVLVRGRGERIEPATAGTFSWVVASFDFGIRSPDAYRWWDEDRAPSGPDPAPTLAAAAAGDPKALGPLLFNDLEAPVVARHPEIAEAKERLLASGALGALMSGSGSSVVGLARDRAHARALGRALPGSRVVSGPPEVPGSRSRR